MTGPGTPGPRPPRIWSVVARVLVRGRYGRAIRADLEEGFRRDLERGMSPRRARRRYAGNVVGSAWSVGRDAAKGLVARGLLLDARLGLRMLGKQPMLTAVAVLALGLGIPSTLVLNHAVSAIFSPLPIPDADRVVGVRHWNTERRRAEMASIHDFVRWRDALTSFESLAAARSYALNLHAGAPGQPPVRGAEMSAEAFGVLGARPLLGRLLTPDDEARGAEDVVVLGEDLWTSRFAADPDVVGRTVRIGRTPHTVVGVLPAEFRAPMDDALWVPLRARPTDSAEGEGPGLWVFGRLRDGVEADDARLEMEVVTARAAEDRPERLGRMRGQVVDMPTLLLREVAFLRADPDFLMVQSLVAALLFVVCGNVGLLVLARTAHRAGELTIRGALGATRRRLVTQIFIESLVLAVVATGLGLLVAEMAARWVTELTAPYDVIPYWVDITVSLETVVTALGLAVVCAGIAGVVPALRATGRGIQANLQRAAAGRATVRFGAGSTVLILTEVVLSVGFLALGGALVGSAFQDTEGRLGMDPERYLSTTVRMPWVDPARDAEYADEAALRARAARTHTVVAERLADADGVAGVGMGAQLPGNDGLDHHVVLEPAPGDSAATPFMTHLAHVHVDFFRGLGRPILAGRDFSPADAGGRPDDHRAPVLVNTTFVEQALGGRSAVGRRFRYEPGRTPADQPEWFEIVGVVGPFGMNPMNPARDAAVYHPLAAGEADPMRYLVEVDGDPAAIAPTFRSIVAAIDPEATVGTRVLAEQWDSEARLFRSIFLAEILLAAVAFLLSVTGLYALMSFTVAQRTREIGIRTALGAPAWDIVSTVARRAALQLGAGLALGAVWAWYLLGSFQSEAMVQPFEIPVVIGVTVAVASLIGVAACARPTLRGLRIQPTEALRES